MDSRETKRTVPVPSVGADGEQPISQTTAKSIADETAENNPQEKDLEEMLRDMRRMNDPAYLHTVSMNDLYQNIYQSRPPVIDGLLYPGTYLFAGAPKVGKSFLMAQLAYHVSMGLPLWGYPVHKGTVLYLALEDDHRRLQGRLYRMFGTEGTDNLLFAVYAKQLGVGLEEQLKKFVREHPNTKLIIIDTLQKIREAGGDKYSYANDYQIITRLKALADSYGISINENGHFAPGGYVTKVSDDFREVYHGPQDIPAEHRVFAYSQLSIREQMAAYQEIIDGSSKEGFRRLAEKHHEER